MLYMRYGISDLIKALHKLALKLHVVSAGVRPVVKECFYHLGKDKATKEVKATIEYCMTPEIYDEKKIIVGFLEPIIITTNKHLFVSHEKYPYIAKGGNAIVMGDLVEDLQIIKNLELTNVISIGFLNAPPDPKSKDFDKYSTAFDIVILNDGNLTHVAELIKHIGNLPMDSSYPKLNATSEYFATFLKSSV